MKRYIKILMVVFFASLMVCSPPSFGEFEENAPPSFADYLHLSPSNDPVDGGWLPNLVGLPDKDQVALLTDYLSNFLANEKDSQCNQIPLNLRMMIFQHFLIHQHMANGQNIYFDEQIANQWAKILAMLLKESSGDSTNITDMNGHSISTYQAHTSLRRWKRILDFADSKIKLNYQTNFGLTQTSADRLFVAFNLAKNAAYDTEFLEGIEGASTPRKIDLNTAIAIRRLIWFYQDFAQGRTSQSEGRIYQEDIDRPEFLERYQTGLKLALLYCGTHFLFNEKGDPNEKETQGLSSFEDAMTTIAYCKLGNSQSGYGKNEFDEKCFAAWVTFCPALNIDIALVTPLKYFATRKAKPVCVDTFKRLINKKPDIKLNGSTANPAELF